MMDTYPCQRGGMGGASQTGGSRWASTSPGGCCSSSPRSSGRPSWCSCSCASCRATPRCSYSRGSSGDIPFTPEEYQAMRAHMGLDRPMYVQYLSWLGKFVTLDWGKSLYYNSLIVDELKPKMILTLELAFVSMAIATVSAIFMGVLAAVKQDTIIDRAIMVFSVTGLAVPTFVMGAARAAVPGQGVLLVPAVGHRLFLGRPYHQPEDAGVAHPGGGLLQQRRHNPHDARPDAGGAAPGLHENGEGQGVDRIAGGLSARLAKRRAAGGNAVRPPDRRAGRRRAGHRDGLQPAGGWAAF